MAKKDIEIIYEDNRIAVASKPVGISVSDNLPGKQNLIELLEKQLKLDCNLIPICKDGDKTGGLIILAKNELAYKNMTELLETTNIKKIYLGIVEGTLLEESGRIDGPLCQCKRDHRRVEINNKHGKEAVTDWQLLADFGSISLLAVRPLQQRRHQVRVHLKYAGMPLVIDPLYSKNKVIMLSDYKYNYKRSKYKEEKPLIDTITLFAYEVEIDNYNDGQKLHLTAGMDKSFKAAVKMLAKYNPNKSDCFVEKDNFDRLLAAEPLVLKI